MDNFFLAVALMCQSGMSGPWKQSSQKECVAQIIECAQPLIPGALIRLPKCLKGENK
jgi:hypothetical protein